MPCVSQTLSISIADNLSLTTARICRRRPLRESFQRSCTVPDSFSSQIFFLCLSFSPAWLSLCITGFGTIRYEVYENRLYPVALHRMHYLILPTLHKIEDQCPCVLSIHLFPHLLSHSSINELLALHRVKEWLFFISASLPYFTHIHNTKLPICSKRREI